MTVERGSSPRCPAPVCSPQQALALVSARRDEWSPAPDEGPLTLVSPLQAGNTSNHSYLLRAGPETLVLRLDGIDPARNAIDRDTECRVQRAAAAAGLAPQPRFCDAAAGVLLVNYLEHDALPGSPSAADVGALLRAIHCLPVAAPRLLLGTRLHHYEALALAEGGRDVRDLVSLLAEPVAAACLAIDTAADTPVICHNDLTPGNRLYRAGTLQAIDWEYAACGSRWFDLAVAAGKAGNARRLLTAYLERAPTARESALLARARLVADYLELLWQICNLPSLPSGLDASQRDLTHRLDTLVPLNARHAV